jgi:DNA end-binding protein Ku
MAPRAYWKGYLRLSLVSCPISLFPATGEREKVRFHQINTKTGNRIRYHKVDEGTGKEVPAAQIVKRTRSGRGSTSRLPTRSWKRSRLIARAG